MTDASTPTDVFEFEGDEVTDFTAQIPSTKLEAPGAWARGTLLNMNVTFRVRSVRIEEDRHGKLIRHHMLAIEDSTLTGVLTPTERRAAMAASEAAELAAQEKVIDEEPGHEDNAPDGAEVQVQEVEQLPEGEYAEAVSDIVTPDGEVPTQVGETIQVPTDGSWSETGEVSSEPDADWSDVEAKDAEKAAEVVDAEVVDEAQYADAENF